MDASNDPLVFYDIASGPPVTCFAPNPWKARYALNFKGLNYRTEWVELPDVASVRKRLGAPPNRTHRDGSAFYTLPVVQDTAQDRIIGDTLEIAQYLDEAYPDTPKLIRPSSIGLFSAFNAHVDAVFTLNGVALCAAGMPFNPKTAEQSKAEFAWRANKTSWDELVLGEEDRVRQIEVFKNALSGLSRCYKHRNEGPFLEGAEPTYADCIAGGWLQFMKATIKPSEWEQLEQWDDGCWKKLHEGMKKYANVH